MGKASKNGTARAQAEKRVGAVLSGKYKLHALLGLGGMGAVYLATHRNGSRVAVKVLHSALAHDVDARRLFLREAYVANRVGHPAALTVLDDDETADGTAYLVMPLLFGETIGARWERLGRRLPVAEVLVVARRLLGVLAAAHIQRIVHRDVKPENLFLTTRGELFVLDFGIARLTDPDAAHVTRTGHAVGTPAFMAPEQALGRSQEIGPHTDIWAVGATMFTLLSGEHVHPAPTSNEALVYAATRRARPLASAVSEVPERVAEVVDRSLRFEPQQRWGSATEMATAIDTAYCATFAGALEDAEPIVGKQDGSQHLSFARDWVPRPSDLHDASTIVPSRAERVNEERAVERVEQPSRATSAAARSVAQSAPKHRRSGWQRFVVAGVVLLGAIGASSVYMTRTRDSVVPSASVPAGSESENLYRAGQRLVHDGAWDSAAAKLERAAVLNPALAAAHLRIVALAHDTGEQTRAHYQRALEFRDSLSPRDQSLLDALKTNFTSPPDWQESAKRLVDLSDSLPADAEIAFYASMMCLNASMASASEATAARALQVDPTFAGALVVHARALLQLGRSADAQNDLLRCREIQPFATDCLDDLDDLYAAEGRCAEAEEISRQLIAIDNTNFVWYIDLARSSEGRGADMATVRAALESSLARAPNAEFLRHKFEYSIAALEGRFQEAMDQINASDELLAAERTEDMHARYAEQRIAVLLELGDTEAAAAAAKAFLAKRVTWIASEPDKEIVGLDGLYAAGRLSRDQFIGKRDAWLARSNPRSSELEKWLRGFAIPARSREDAVAAANSVPTDALTNSLAVGRVDDLEAAARVFLAAGDLDRAEQYGRAAVGTCTALNFPIEHTHSLKDLADTLAMRGKLQEACKLYGRVLERWGNASGSVTASRARDAWRTYACAAGTQRDD